MINAKEQLLASEGRALDGAMRHFKADALQKYARAFDRLDQFGQRLQRHSDDVLQHGQRQVEQLGKLLESYSFHSVLNRGFALERDQDGHPVLSAADVQGGDMIGIEFGDGEVRARVSDGTTGTRPVAAPRKREPGSSGNQGSLL